MPGSSDAAAATVSPSPASPNCPVSYPPTAGHVAYLSDEELAASLQSAFRHHAPNEDIWLFAYGSLIWNPGMPFAESVPARISGYHRGLCMWSRHNRGTPEQPGLVLALDNGGSCPGIGFRLPIVDSDAHLATLWKREMSLGAYRPSWLRCTLADGRRVRALSFVIRRDSSAYAGQLDDAVFRHVLATASGHFGSTLEYVEKTVVALRAAGIPDRKLESLLQRCVGAGQ